MQLKSASNLAGLASALPIAMLLTVASCAGLALADTPSPTSTPTAQSSSSNGLYGPPVTNNGLYGDSSPNNGLYGDPVNNPGLYGDPVNNPGLYGNSANQPEGLGGGSAQDPTQTSNSPDSAPLPDTGSADVVSSVIGLTAVIGASFIYVRSRRRATASPRKDGKIVA